MHLWLEIMIVLGVCLPFTALFLFKVAKYSKSRMTSAQTTQQIEQFLNSVDFPIWFVDDDMRLTFCNSAFHEIEERCSKAFSLRKIDASEPIVQRVLIEDTKTKQPAWFDISTKEIEGGYANYALDITGLAHAEQAQRNFVQTLTKTFAHLSIGLAIFDQKRKLILFNPALIGLTRLGAEFLSGKPDLMSVFDRLRDSQIMPEPKDYAAWRQRLNEITAEVEQGLYQELWSLPNGSVYRVTGRPHPDGAIAILFEDISSEMITSRRLKSDLGIYHQVFDGLDNAIVLFSETGRTLFENLAYYRLWQHTDERAISTDIFEELDVWQTSFGENQFWAEVRRDLNDIEGMTAWNREVSLPAGQRFNFTLKKLSGGLLMAKWTPLSEVDKTRVLTESRHVA